MVCIQTGTCMQKYCHVVNMNTSNWMPKNLCRQCVYIFFYHDWSIINIQGVYVSYMNAEIMLWMLYSTCILLHGCRDMGIAACAHILLHECRNGNIIWRKYVKVIQGHCLMMFNAYLNT